MMTMLRKRVSCVLAAGACLMLVASPAAAGKNKGVQPAVNVFLPHVESNGTLSTNGTMVIGVGKINLKNGKATVVARGGGAEPVLRKGRLCVSQEHLRPAAPVPVCKYVVNRRLESSSAQGFGVSGFNPPPSSDGGDGGGDDDDDLADLVDDVDGVVDADLTDNDGGIVDAIDNILDLDLSDDNGDGGGLIDAIDDLLDADLSDGGDGGLLDTIDSILDVDLFDDGGGMDGNDGGLLDAIDDLLDIDLGDDGGDGDGLDLLDAVDSFLDLDLFDGVGGLLGSQFE